MNKNKKQAQISIYLGRGRSIRLELYKDGSNSATYPKEMSSVEMVLQLRNIGYLLTRMVTKEEFEILENKPESDTMTKEGKDE